MAGGADEPLRFRGDSGVQRLLGHNILVYRDRAEVVMAVEERYLNRWGVVHGGLITVLLDSACGYACSRRFSDDATARIITLSLTTNFLAPGRVGPFTAVGRVTGGGRKVCFADGEVFDGDGTLIASATGTFKKGHGHV